MLSNCQMKVLLSWLFLLVQGFHHFQRGL